MQCFLVIPIWESEATSSEDTDRAEGDDDAQVLDIRCTPVGRNE